MNSYNGYSGPQRLKALAWIKKQYAKGVKPPKPCACDVCSQTEGLLMWHSEDYSEPFGENIGRFGLCYICHMMIHCRFRNPYVWQKYKEAINDGFCFEPYYKNDWNSFRVEFLLNKFQTRKYEKKSHNKAGLLDLIEKGVYADEGSEEYKALSGSPFAL